jgi:hypothetical protein
MTLRTPQFPIEESSILRSPQFEIEESSKLRNSSGGIYFNIGENPKQSVTHGKNK